jgi:hypothetical protein
MYLEIVLREIWPNELAHFGYNFAEFFYRVQDPSGFEGGATYWYLYKLNAF